MFDDDIGVDLPQEEIQHTAPDGSKKYGIFRFHAQLAVLEGRIYSSLYSIRARNRTELQRLQSVGELDKALQDVKVTQYTLQGFQLIDAVERVFTS
jgi:hypothetical protein